jgi:hypothetical protein
MNSSVKNAILWGAEVIVSLVIGTIVALGVRRLVGGGEIDRDAIILCITATLGPIIYLTLIGVFPVGAFPRDEKKP